MHAQHAERNDEYKGIMHAVSKAWCLEEDAECWDYCVWGFEQKHGDQRRNVLRGNFGGL